MFKWINQLFRRMKKCKHHWIAVRVSNYVRYKDSRQHFESKCTKCGATCDHPTVFETGVYSGPDGIPHHSVRCKVCGMHSIESGAGQARFLCNS